MACTFIPVLSPLRQNLFPKHNALDARHRPNPSLPLALTRSSPRMTSTAVVVTDILVLSTITAGAYYAFLRQNTGKTATEEDSAESRSPSDGAIIGLQGSNTAVKGVSFASSESSVETSDPIPTASPYDNDSVGVNINDFLDDRDVGSGSADPKSDSRVREELDWAVMSLLDLDDCDAVAIVDAKNTVIVSGGPLITDVSDAGEISARLLKSRAIETKNVSGNDQLPFVGSTVKSYAAMPIGERGGPCVMLASNQIDFLVGDKEMRVATAVCNRLASYSLRT